MTFVRRSVRSKRYHARHQRKIQVAHKCARHDQNSAQSDSDALISLSTGNGVPYNTISVRYTRRSIIVDAHAADPAPPIAHGRWFRNAKLRRASKRVSEMTHLQSAIDTVQWDQIIGAYLGIGKIGTLQDFADHRDVLEARLNHCSHGGYAFDQPIRSRAVHADRPLYHGILSINGHGR